MAVYFQSKCFIKIRVNKTLYSYNIHRKHSFLTIPCMSVYAWLENTAKL